MDNDAKFSSCASNNYYMAFEDWNSTLCHICPYTKGLVEYLSKRIGLVARHLLMSWNFTNFTLESCGFTHPWLTSCISQNFPSAIDTWIWRGTWSSEWFPGILYGTWNLPLMPGNIHPSIFAINVQGYEQIPYEKFKVLSDRRRSVPHIDP